VKEITLKMWDEGDWIEVWVDGECVTRDHSFTVNDLWHLLEFLGYTIKRERVPA
jgi:hypothetical protein